MQRANLKFIVIMFFAISDCVFCSVEKATTGTFDSLNSLQGYLLASLSIYKEAPLSSNEAIRDSRFNTIYNDSKAGPLKPLPLHTVAIMLAKNPVESRRIFITMRFPDQPRKDRVEFLKLENAKAKFVDQEEKPDQKDQKTTQKLDEVLNTGELENFLRRLNMHDPDTVSEMINSRNENAAYIRFQSKSPEKRQKSGEKVPNKPLWVLVNRLNPTAEIKTIQPIPVPDLFIKPEATPKATADGIHTGENPNDAGSPDTDNEHSDNEKHEQLN